MDQEKLKALEFWANRPDLDLRTFECSDEYRILNMGCSFCNTFNSLYSGTPIVIDGDLEKIIILNKNEINLIILYADKPEKQYVKIIYDSSHYVDFIRKELLPMTHIRLNAQYTERIGEFKGRDIESYNKALMYGHYICPSCGHDYGIDKIFDGNGCEICADDRIGKLKYITDYYRLNT